MVDALPLEQCKSRFELWAAFINKVQARTVLEIGVWKGDFAEFILRNCPSISRYYMLDPWRHLSDWDKPANVPDTTFELHYSETVRRTSFAEYKRVILRGKTTEVINEIADESIDFAYIDGDHTLKGVAIDLVRTHPKIRTGGHIGGDDFCASIWQHPNTYEPTLVFPMAVHFAEAVGNPIRALRFNQFLICKTSGDQFSFEDPEGTYKKTNLRDQLLVRNEKR